MNANIKQQVDTYPKNARTLFIKIRTLIYDVVNEEQLGEVSESLKWGEPSYAVIKGSPMRMSWKAKYPQQISLYFNCNTTLIETFNELYADALQFKGNREIVIPFSSPIPQDELKDCISMALRYHRIKHLPLLGA